MILYHVDESLYLILLDNPMFKDISRIDIDTTFLDINVYIIANWKSLIMSNVSVQAMGLEFYQEMELGRPMSI